jgi:hypothetical protein
VVKKEKTRFQLPSSTNYFCEMLQIPGGYELTFYNSGEKMKTVQITEAQLDRQYLYKLVINVGIDFYALTGPYDCADEILRVWHKYYKPRSFLERLFGR